MTQQAAHADLDREQQAHREVGHTTISGTLAGAMVLCFLAILAVLPAIETLGSARGGTAPGAWSHVFGIGRSMQQRLAEEGPGAPATAWNTVVTANRAALSALEAFETALEDQSAVGRLLRPPMQYALTAYAGAGNERVYVGRDGWLFYRPDVEYVTGRAFLDERQMQRRRASAAEYDTAPQPDPRPAIVQFKQALAERGIALVLMPTPVKPTVHGEHLAGAAAVGRGSLQNPSYAPLLEELRAAGVLVFDPLDVIGPAPEAEAYLRTDTHWRPETMQRVADGLAAFVRTHVPLPQVAPPGYTVEPREARHTGDIAAMLDLPAARPLFPPERASLRFVVDPAGDPWRASRDADVLLLGDSFTNIYSLPSMGWGEAAGLAEQLSVALQRPLDRIVQNDQGAFATREILQREAVAGTDRLAGKRVVIWQFAARELAFGDWKVWD